MRRSELVLVLGRLVGSWQACISTDEDSNESLAAIVGKMTCASSGQCLASRWPNSRQTSHDGTWSMVTPVRLLRPKTLHLSGCGDVTKAMSVPVTETRRAGIAALSPSSLSFSTLVLSCSQPCG